MQSIVQIFTDGSCLGNPGPGGWAAILKWKDSSKEISNGLAPTTNNRMELLAVIAALETLKKKCDVRLFTDSRYIHDAITKKWLDSWIKKGWKTAAKKPVKNIDLWKRLIPLLERHSIRFSWVKGHAGHPENERCDQLAREAASRPTLPKDPGYVLQQ